MHPQWREAFGQTEGMALRALAQQFRNLRQWRVALTSLDCAPYRATERWRSASTKTS
jgi:hypothetical protein